MATKNGVSGIWGIVSALLGVLFDRLSPEIKKLLKDFLKGLYKKALLTPNPIDDTLVKFLASLLSIELE